MANPHINMANVVNRSGKPRTIRMVIDSPPLYHDPVTGGYWPMYDGHVKCFFSMIRYECNHQEIDTRCPEINHSPFCPGPLLGRTNCNNAFYGASIAVISTNKVASRCAHCSHMPLDVCSHGNYNPRHHDSDYEDSNDDDDEKDKDDGCTTPDPALGFVPNNAEEVIANSVGVLAGRLKGLGEEIQHGLVDVGRVGVLRGVFGRVMDNLRDVEDLVELASSSISRVWRKGYVEARGVLQVSEEDE